MGPPEAQGDRTMNDEPEQALAPTGDEQMRALRPAEDDALRRLVDQRPPPTPEVAEALAQLEAARGEVESSLDQLSSATQSALDIPAKIRRNPARTVALVGGAGFLLVGGPKRVIRSAVRAVRPERPDPYSGLLPEEIEKVLKEVGLADDPEIRRALDQDFADYLKSKGRYEPTPTAAASFWRTFDRLAGPLGTAGARILVQRLMEAERGRSRGTRGAPPL
jgi:hypothetical protein